MFAAGVDAHDESNTRTELFQINTHFRVVSSGFRHLIFTSFRKTEEILDVFV